MSGPREWRRLPGRGGPAVLAVVAAALVAAGCGGGGGGGGSKDSHVAAATPPAPAKGTGLSTPAPSGHRHKRHGHHAPRPSGSSSHAAPAPTKHHGNAVAQLPRGERTNFVRTTVQTLLQGAGLQVSSVTISSAGDVVRATVAASSACAAGGDAMTTVLPRLRQVLPGVHTVDVTVSGTGKSLADFVSSCPKPRPPAGPGRVVLAQQGKGVAVTQAFTVRSQRWTVAFVNGSGSLQIQPLKNGKPAGKPFSVSQAGAGTHTFKGRGTYKLSMGTFGSWQVRVRDGA